MPPYIYVASSWRNSHFEPFVDFLREAGYPVYDFKRDKGASFHWTDAGLDFGDRSTVPLAELKSCYGIDRVQRAARTDYKALYAATHLILVLDCGKSAHLELGHAIGRGIPTAIYCPDGELTPELMYFPVDLLTADSLSILRWLEHNETLIGVGFRRDYLTDITMPPDRYLTPPCP